MFLAHLCFIAQVYFTSLPYDIYNQANRCGNMAYAGIGLGLIKAQQLFWIANIGVITISLNETVREVSFILVPFCSFLYMLSLIKIQHLTSFIPARDV